MVDILAYLDEVGIEYEHHEHPAVYTVEDVEQLVPPLAGTKTKNLFLRDPKGRRHFLVTVPAAKRVDLKALAAELDSGKLSFGSAQRLKRYLGIEPGAVSLLAAANDSEHAVEVVVDKELWSADALQYHPLVNTATLVIARDGIRRFLEQTGHAYRLLNVPAR
jgi:Ala-tRNA(Pro) deacylase